jgi:hypothetical protein
MVPNIFWWEILRKRWSSLRTCGFSGCATQIPEHHLPRDHGLEAHNLLQ